MGASSRWLEDLQQRWLDEASARDVSPYDPSADPDGAQWGDEKEFQRWYAPRAKRFGINPNPDDPQQFYDYRAAWRAGAEPGSDGHWPSEFKLEGHPRLIVDGVNTKTGQAVDPGSILAPEDSAQPPQGSPDFTSRLASGVARGGVGGGLSALFADPNAPREGGGGNTWDMFSGVAKGIGRALGSAYGNPGFSIAAREADSRDATRNALIEQNQRETERELSEKAEKRARAAAVTRATQGIDPTTKEGNRKAVAILAQMQEYDLAKAVAGLYKEEPERKPPPTRVVEDDLEKIESEWNPETGEWREIARAPIWNPRERGTSVTVSPQIIMPGHSEPTPAETTALQGKTIQTNDMLARLHDTERMYDPSYQQLGTKAQMWASQWTEKLGGSLSAEDAGKLDRYVTFRATAFDNLSQTLKEMSGAAVTPQEYERLKQSLPDPGTGIVGTGDSPTVFEAKLRRASRASKLALLRYSYAQQMGIPIDGIPLDVGTMKQRIGDRVEKAALAAGRSQQDAEALAVAEIQRVFKGL